MKFNDKIILTNENLIKKYDYYDRDFIFHVGYVVQHSNIREIIFVSELNNWFASNMFKVVTEKDIRKMKLNKIKHV